MRVSRGFLRVPRSKRKNEKVKMLQELAILSTEKFEQAAQLICGITIRAMLEDLKAVINNREELDKFIREKITEAEMLIKQGER